MSLLWLFDSLGSKEPAEMSDSSKYVSLGSSLLGGSIGLKAGSTKGFIRLA